MIALARIVWLATGVMWAARSLVARAAYLIALASVAVAPRWFATYGRGATGEPTSAPDLVVRA